MGLLVALVVGACRLDVDYGSSRYACDPAGGCPAGMACQEGFCSSGGAVDGAPGDADARPEDPDAPAASADASPEAADAAAPADAPAVPCLLGNIADDFATPAPAAFWMPFAPQPPAAADQSTGQLVITLATGTTGSRYAGYTYAADSDARGQRLQVEVPQVPSTASGANAFFKLQNGDNYGQAAGFLVQAGQLAMDTTDATGATLSHATLAYSATAHRFWALAEDGGTVSFSTSPDGVAWTVRVQVPAPFPFEHARVSLGAGTWQPEASPGLARFDNLGAGPASDCYGHAP